MEPDDPEIVAKRLRHLLPYGIQPVAPVGQPGFAPAPRPCELSAVTRTKLLRLVVDRAQR